MTTTTTGTANAIATTRTGNNTNSTNTVVSSPPTTTTTTTTVFERLFRVETAASTSLKKLSPHKMTKVRAMRMREAEAKKSASASINTRTSAEKSLDPLHVPFVTRTDEEYEIAVERAIVNWNIILSRMRNGNGGSTGTGTGTGIGDNTTNTTSPELRRRNDADLHLAKILVSLEKCRRWRNARNRMNKTIYVGDNGDDDDNEENVLRVIDDLMGIQPHELYVHEKEEIDKKKTDHRGGDRELGDGVEGMTVDMEGGVDINVDADVDVDVDVDGYRSTRRRRRRTFHEKLAYNRSSRRVMRSRSFPATARRNRSRPSSAMTYDDDRLSLSRRRSKSNHHFSTYRHRHRYRYTANNSHTCNSETEPETETETLYSEPTNPNSHFHVEKLLISNKYNPTRGWRTLPPTTLNLIHSLTQFEDGILDAPLVSCHIISSLFEKDFCPGDEWVIHNTRARRIRQKKKKKGGKNLGGQKQEQKQELEQEQEQQSQVFRVEKRATWNWNEIQSESVARGDVKFLPHQREIHIEEYEYYVAGHATKPAQIFERLFYTDTAASASLKRVKWTHHHRMLPPSLENTPRIKLSSIMKTRDENRMIHANNANGHAHDHDDDHILSIQNSSSTTTASTLPSNAASSLSTVTPPTTTRHYHSTKIQLLMSSKFTHGRGLTNLSPSELGLVQILAEYEHSCEWGWGHHRADDTSKYPYVARQSTSRSPIRGVGLQRNNSARNTSSPIRSSNSRNATPYRYRRTVTPYRPGTNMNTNSPIQSPKHDITSNSNNPTKRISRSATPYRRMLHRNSPVRSPITARNADHHPSSPSNSHSPMRSPTRYYNHPQISSRQVAHAIIDALFQRDFEPGPRWEIDASKVEKIGPPSAISQRIIGGGQHENDKNSDVEELYRVEKQATWDCDDYYSVASARGTIRFLPRINEIRLESYTYYVAG